MLKLKALFPVIIALLLTTLSGNASAQTAWTAWLYSPQDGSIIHVNQAGEVTGNFYLPLTQGFNGYGREVVVSASGRYFAYTAYDSTQEPTPVQLFVYDQLVGTIGLTYDLTGAQATGFEFATSSLVIDEEARRIAFGYLTANDGWRVVVGDFATASVVATLEEAESLAATTLPVVQNLNGSVVTFTAVNYGTNLLPAYPALSWNFETNEITSDERYTTLLVDTDAETGQIAAGTVENGDAGAEPDVVLNAVQIVSTGGQHTLLYSEPDAWVQRVIFIEHGARVLVETYNRATDETRLKVLNRDGSVGGELLGSLDQLTGTPDGFVGLFDNGGAPALAYVNTTDGTLSPVTVWSGAAGTAYILIRVAGS